MTVELENHVSHLTLDFGAVRQSERFRRVRFDPESAQDRLWYHRVNCSGIDEQAELLRFLRISGIRNRRFNVGQSHTISRFTQQFKRIFRAFLSYHISQTLCTVLITRPVPA